MTDLIIDIRTVKRAEQKWHLNLIATPAGNAGVLYICRLLSPEGRIIEGVAATPEAAERIAWDGAG